MADFAYKGIPIYDDNGNVKYVQPVKGIVAEDGKTYKGVLDVNSRGNRFVYNKVPNTFNPLSIPTINDITYTRTNSTIVPTVSATPASGSSIAGYSFSIDGTTWSPMADSNTYTFNRLNEGTGYTIYVRVYDASLQYASEEIAVETVSPPVISDLVLLDRSATSLNVRVDATNDGGGALQYRFASDGGAVESGQNLFDKDDFGLFRGWVDLDGILGGGWSPGDKTFYIPITGGETYVVTKKPTIDGRFRAGTLEAIPETGAILNDFINSPNSPDVTITTSNNANYLVVQYWVQGNDEQEILDSIRVVRSENLFYLNKPSPWVTGTSGLTITLNDDGTVSIDGTWLGTATTLSIFVTIPDGTYTASTPIHKNTRYTMSYRVVDGTANLTSNIGIYSQFASNDGTQRIWNALVANATTPIATRAFDLDGHLGGYHMYITRATATTVRTFDNYTMAFQVEVGGQMTDFKPYTSSYTPWSPANSYNFTDLVPLTDYDIKVQVRNEFGQRMEDMQTFQTSAVYEVASGEFITLSDSAESPVKSLTLNGNSYQEVEEDEYPSVEVPSEIKGVKGNIDVISSRGNMFQEQGFSTPANRTDFWVNTLNPNTLVPLTDGYMRATFEDNTSTNIIYVNFFIRNGFVDYKSNTDYTIFVEFDEVNMSPTISGALNFNQQNLSVSPFTQNVHIELNNTITNGSIVKLLVTTKADVETNSDYYSLRTFIAQRVGSGAFSLKFRAMILEGDRGIEEAFEFNTQRFPLLANQTLDELIDYQDSLVSDGIHKNTQRTILDGSEAWTVGSYIGANTVTFMISYFVPLTLTNSDVWCKSNKFMSYTRNYLINEDIEGCFINNGGVLLVRINKSRLDTVDLNGFKTWLNTNNVEILHPQAESIIPYTEAQEEAYINMQSVRTYLEKTNLTAPSEGMNAYIDVVYVVNL